MVRLELNTLGESDERAEFRAALVAYLAQHRDKLDEDSQRRLGSNPLRILDSKSAQTQAVLADAPRLADFLGEDSRAIPKAQSRERRAGSSASSGHVWAKRSTASRAGSAKVRFSTIFARPCGSSRRLR